MDALAHGRPVVLLLNIKKIFSAYGFVFDPASLPPIGSSPVYQLQVYPRWLAVTGLVLTLATLLAGGLRYRRQLTSRQAKDREALISLLKTS